MSNFELLTQERFPVKGWTRGVPVEDQAKQQLHNVADLPFIYKHVAAMPDCHFGKGATIGSVIATKGAIIPAAVGVDLGCGMVAARTNLTANDLPDNLVAMRSAIEAAVPHGYTKGVDRGSWGTAPENVLWRFGETGRDSLAHRLGRITEKHSKIARSAKRAVNQLGTLGGGNHFIEICLDEVNDVWIMLHSGSRGIGNAIGSYFIERAKNEMARYFIHLPDKDLAYLVEGSELFDDYFTAVEWAQNFAASNRWAMLNAVRRVLNVTLCREEDVLDCDMVVVDCHHNYVARENHFGQNVLVTRKGAVRAREGDLGIIPGNMGMKSFIVRGKGNPESFMSCSHGAGRAMSRTEAKRRFTVEDHITATQGVECRKDKDVLDETPGAYKDLDAVMAAQSDLCEVVHTLKQVVCVKG